MFDVVVEGGGPAGLNAALVLGRAQRRVLVLGSGGRPGARPDAMYGPLPCDGASPNGPRPVDHRLDAYPDVRVRDIGVASAVVTRDGFDLILADGTTERARRLLLARGPVAGLPPIEGVARLWGRGVFHCPHCQGRAPWSDPIAVLGGDAQTARLAAYLATISPQVVLCPGDHLEDAALREILSEPRVRVRVGRVTAVVGRPGRVEKVVFADGEPLRPGAVFLRPHTRQLSGIPGQVGCALREDGQVRVNGLGQTSVPGVYAASDLCEIPTRMAFPAGEPFVAAAGVVPAVVIDLELTTQDGQSMTAS